MSLTPERTAELQELCRQYRIDVLTAIHGAQSGHPGGSLSVCEILTLLYQQRMHVDAAHPDDPDRDRLVLCKGHAAPMLYRNLIGKGFLPPESMNTLRQTGLGDGELDEGAVWEAAASAVKFGLDNLTAIVDWNKVQLDGTTDEIMPLRDLPGKWKAFGWNVLRCDGHDLAALDAALDAAVACKGVPTVILADTIKGKGVSFMEGKSAWHGKAIPDAEFAQAMQELGGNV